MTGLISLHKPPSVRRRSVHSEQCRKPFDALVLCTRGLLEPKICAEVAAAYNPCAKEMKRKELMIAKQVR